ncbi:MAG: hypothetical protein KBT12_04635 [Bacteroidales bacterium]|nr:hypothetical protein [Candidatus Physcousia equi]
MVNKKYQTPRVRVVDFTFSHMIAVSPVDGGKSPVVTDPEEEKDAGDAMARTESSLWDGQW